MDNLLFTSLCNYFTALSKIGYQKYSDVKALLVLCFYRQYVYGNTGITYDRDDLDIIQRALNCLYGSSCLIPYGGTLRTSCCGKSSSSSHPVVVGTGDSYFGDTSEFSFRLSKLENTTVVKLGGGMDPDSDVYVEISTD